MKLIQLIPITARVKFLKYRIWAFIASSVLVLGSILLTTFHGLNFGIDFTGGVLVEIEKTDSLGVESLRQTLADMTPEIQSSNKDTIISIRLPLKDEASQKEQIESLKSRLGSDVIYRSVEMVGPKVGGELIEQGVYAVLLSILAICVYIWLRFEMGFAVAAMIALFHDIILTVGFFAISGIEFNLTAVAAILTLAGYSVNDTVVVYDRIRENAKKYRKMNLGDLLDLSLNETLSRTILTSFTVFVAVFALALFGGSVLGSFSYAMLFGLLTGTYSSIYIAVPLLLRSKHLF